MHNLIPLLHLAGLRPLIVAGLRTAALLIDSEGLILLRDDLDADQAAQVADQVLHMVTESSVSA